MDIGQSAGSFVWASVPIVATPGPVYVAGIGALSQALYYFKFTIQPTLSITPFIGPPGQPLQASGTGYTARETVGTYFGALSAPMMPTTTADATGAFGPITVTIPAHAAPKSTDYPVYAATVNRAPVQPYGMAWFYVAPTSGAAIAVQAQGTTATGAPGGPLTVAGEGWTAGDTVHLSWGTQKVPTSTVLASATTGPDGRFVTTVPIATEY